MYHVLLEDVNFWLFLLSIDKDLATSARRSGCPCGGRLHCANYLRNPRGGPDHLAKECCYRLSFCCGRNGCRKRVTPPSTRFLGPKVYLAAVILLAAANRQGPSPRAMRELSKLFGADRRTIARWQVLWCEHFPHSRFWKVARAAFVPAIEEAALPRSLLEAFLRTDDPREDWKRLLCFLSPITIAEGLAVEVPR